MTTNTGLIRFPTRIVLLALAGVAAAISLNDSLRAEGGAADVSAWDRSTHSAVRLLSGRDSGSSATITAAIEITLEPGWKTYWRYPGDSGVPPRFDFSASENVATVVAQFPAPKRFKDGNGTSIGYGERVIFPLRVIAKDPKKPVTLRGKFDYAICEKLCVPVDAKAMLTLQPATAATASVLATAVKRVPQTSELGAKALFAIIAAKREDGAKPRVVVDVAAPAGKKVDLFAEGPTQDWSLPLPEPIDGAPAGAQRFAFEIDGMPPGVSASGATLTLTATSDTDAIEVPFKLD
ncbi:hypothetical protein GJW-30_1_02561 [Variibacter gotjawalensis]|uniref:Thiol:disulfide interchange protein DsbD N-terminal domain-containing protein n=1 Tax=Variibacter gotjawalensis TaxID=1333996 RepID=A0A0S3PVR1_9BRAD|nr:protein-disulfide reductase DsbD domain-containing protein [Variibacter gotjawalensis]NIK45849.1 DsbC/DsbD-like thiol-disulfide interchange protein [Variibacter gotjawalensis]RZS47772.1 DsbC/DsbD-like thiol-disulfide interchange protein [Variibacter gotjawalensis]BAT60026.1 hypothetical protein GJW-30_1_02561 [Variibacter gotjawalensis]